MPANWNSVIILKIRCSTISCRNVLKCGQLHIFTSWIWLPNWTNSYWLKCQIFQTQFALTTTGPCIKCFVIQHFTTRIRICYAMSMHMFQSAGTECVQWCVRSIGWGAEQSTVCGCSCGENYSEWPILDRPSVPCGCAPGQNEINAESRRLHPLLGLKIVTMKFE